MRRACSRKSCGMPVGRDHPRLPDLGHRLRPHNALFQFAHPGQVFVELPPIGRTDSVRQALDVFRHEIEDAPAIALAARRLAF